MIYGKEDGLTDHIDLATPLNSSQGFKIKGAYTSANLTISMSCAGDMNNDGFGNIILSSWTARYESRTDARELKKLIFCI